MGGVIDLSPLARECTAWRRIAIDLAVAMATRAELGVLETRALDRFNDLIESSR